MERPASFLSLAAIVLVSSLTSRVSAARTDDSSTDGRLATDSQETGRHALLTNRVAANRSGHAEVAALHKNVLACTLDSKKNIYEEEHMRLSCGWGNDCAVSPATLERLGYSPLRNSSWYTTENVHGEMVKMMPLLEDLSSRINKSYWFVGGGLIGALRSGTLIPWDEDIDWCLESKAGPQIREAYSSEQVEIMKDFVGQSMGDRNSAWKDYYVATNKDGSQVYIFSMRTGLKMEMLYAPWHCSRSDLALPVRRELVDGVMVSIPRSPMEWLRSSDHYSCSNFAEEPMPASIRMHVSAWSSCWTCASSDLPAAAGVGTQQAGPSSEVFLFGVEGTSPALANFMRTQRIAPQQLNAACKAVDHGAYYVQPLTGFWEAGFSCKYGLTGQECCAFAVALAILAASLSVKAPQEGESGSGGSFQQLVYMAFRCLWMPAVACVLACDYYWTRMVSERHGGYPFSVPAGMAVLALARLLVSAVALVMRLVLLFYKPSQGFAISPAAGRREVLLLFLLAALGAASSGAFFAACRAVDMATLAITLEVWTAVTVFKSMGAQNTTPRIAFVGVLFGITAHHLGQSGLLPGAIAERTEGVEPWSWGLLVHPLILAVCMVLRDLVQVQLQRPLPCFELVNICSASIELGLIVLLILVLDPPRLGPDFFEGMWLWECGKVFRYRIAVVVLLPYLTNLLGSLRCMALVSAAGPVAVGIMRHFDLPVFEEISSWTVGALVVTYAASTVCWSSYAEGKFSGSPALDSSKGHIESKA
eukprot:TRINITY_DN65747_c0_g1_i1.p1 TRINITY_DN65747_c0_g1~~TRINITY_DN65747_c0_g1_i1.p1  ORF type:complete len:782 (+),score=98.24 TRINITY_DN65747_c0_g1_i1:66-2348(+)